LVILVAKNKHFVYSFITVIVAACFMRTDNGNYPRRKIL